ncbi:MAG TPA: enoyl-CoA hydratase/isomerase family protein, partial [Vicinamibacteria bacterium]|nr:enoyl-CoA hydratase/isomerase family protein [Vicinamibacteria bacterium]
MSGIRVEREGRTAVLRMDKARGNAIDEPFAEDLVRACREVAADDGAGAVMLASAHPRLFCPGLDLVTLYEYDRASMGRFLGRFGEAVLGLYGMRKPVLAAISGHAVAGGCVLALTADHRMLRRGSQIGLNEVRVGLPLPWSV